MEVEESGVGNEQRPRLFATDAPISELGEVVSDPSLDIGAAYHPAGSPDHLDDVTVDAADDRPDEVEPALHASVNVELPEPRGCDELGGLRRGEAAGFQEVELGGEVGADVDGEEGIESDDGGDVAAGEAAGSEEEEDGVRVGGGGDAPARRRRRLGLAIGEAARLD